MGRRIIDDYRKRMDNGLSFSWVLRLGLLAAWAGVMLLLFLLEGCTQADVEGEVEVATEAKATFYMNVLSTLPPKTRSLTLTKEGTLETDSLPAAGCDTLVTKAGDLGEAAEGKIHTLWVGQYGSDGSLLYSSYHTLNMSGNQVELMLKVTQAVCRVYFVANTADLTSTVSDEETLKKLTLKPATIDGAPTDNRCVMTGCWSGTVGRGGITGNVDMKRITAKITFNYSFGGSDFTFDVSTVRLYNVPDRSQLIEPVGQLSGIGYLSYGGTVSNSGATIYWYLPENRAGNGTSVAGEKNKTGEGVTNATYIEVCGTAKQGNVTYRDVAFRLYPGSGKDNYTIGRNDHFTISLRLIGIDLSDDRVTVGSIPGISNPDNMAAESGSVKSVQITARPGQNWMIQLPAWLSATISGQVYGVGAQISTEGPRMVEFKAANSNPKKEERTQEFTLNIPDERKFTVKQNGSVLQNVTVDNPTMEAGSGENILRFTATSGLGYTGTNTLGGASWTNGNTGQTNGNEQQLKFAVAINPGSAVRKGEIGVKVGDDLSGTVAIEQKGSTLDLSSSSMWMGATGLDNNSFVFKASKQLSWNVASNADWLSLTDSPLSGTNNTTGENQTVNFNIGINPTASKREGKITVKVGDAVNGTDANLVKTFTVAQDNSKMSIDINTYWIFAFSATKGLNFSAESNADWLVLSGETSGTTTGSRQSFGYSFSGVNPNANERQGKITITAGEIKKEGHINQTASTFGVYTMEGTAEVATNSVELNFNGSNKSGGIFLKGTNGLNWIAKFESGNNTITPYPKEKTLSGNEYVSWTNSEHNRTTEKRTAIFKFSIKGGDGSHDKKITVTQNAAPYFLTITQAHVDAFMVEGTRQNKKLLPFLYDPGNGGAKVTNFKGDPKTLKLTANYRLEVDNTTNFGVSSYNGSVKQCAGLGTGWRIPTLLELYVIREELYGASGIYAFNTRYYMSSSTYQGGADHPRIYMSNGNFSTAGVANVRCVRDM